jgi:acetyl esterase/lipase
VRFFVPPRCFSAAGGVWHRTHARITDRIALDDGVEQTLGSQYQPYPTGTPPPLQCYRFAPVAPYDPPYPTVLMLPPNVFQNDMIVDGGEPHERQASRDLTDAGFLVFQVESRLAPPGMLDNQLSTDKGYAPEQNDDIKRQILSALTDPLTNGNIYLVGGSAGGCLALWCALDPASTVSGWDENARSHIKAVVSLSGPSQFCDWSNPGGIPPDALTDFEQAVVNYVHLPYSLQPPCDPACDFGVVNCPLDQASPAWLVTHGATSNPPPFMLYATNGDPVPNSQAEDMWQALTTKFHDLKVDLWIMTYQYDTRYDHAFDYWQAKNDAVGSDGDCVSNEVINFLQTH